MNTGSHCFIFKSSPAECLTSSIRSRSFLNICKKDYSYNKNNFNLSLKLSKS